MYDKCKCKQIEKAVEVVSKYVLSSATYFGVVLLSCKIGECIGSYYDNKIKSEILNLDLDTEDKSYKKSVNKIDRKNFTKTFILSVISRISIGSVGNRIVKRIWKK